MHRRSEEEFYMHLLERFSFCFVLRSVISYLIVEMHVFVCRFVVQDLDSELIGFRFVYHFTKADFMIVVYCLLLIHSQHLPFVRIYGSFTSLYYACVLSCILKRRLTENTLPTSNRPDRHWVVDTKKDYIHFFVFLFFRLCVCACRKRLYEVFDKTNDDYLLLRKM